MVKGPVSSENMLEKGKAIDAAKTDAELISNLDELSQHISCISLESQGQNQKESNSKKRISASDSEFSDRSSMASVIWNPCIMEEICNELNNNAVGTSVIERGNRAKLRRSNSTIPRNRRSGRTVSDPVRSVIPKVCSTVVRSFSLNRQPIAIGHTESFWEDGCKTTDLCCTEL